MPAIHFGSSCCAPGREQALDRWLEELELRAGEGQRSARLRRAYDAWG